MANISKILRGFFFLSIGFLVSCYDRDNLAPVEEAQWRAADTKATHYKVVQGDTLYSIAFRYDLDYREMASFNHLTSPYVLKIGQILQLKPIPGSEFNPITSNPHRLKQLNLSSPRPLPSSPSRSLSYAYKNSPSGWMWPAHGHVVENFAPQRGAKGINIAGKKGDKIYAADSGVVAYAGNGLQGYGNLIIIKHNNQYMTAYGNNLQNKVHEGQRIQKGQVIADMGIINRKYWGVHFEIRQQGRPVNPLQGFLQKTSPYRTKNH